MPPKPKPECHHGGGPFSQGLPKVRQGCQTHFKDGQLGHLDVAKAMVHHGEGNLGAASHPLTKVRFPKALTSNQKDQDHYLSPRWATALSSHINPESTWRLLAAILGHSIKSAGHWA